MKINLKIYLIRIYQMLVSKNPLFHKYKFDNISTKCNMSFINEAEFSMCYSKSIEFSGRDYQFYLRVHQAIWCASIAIHIDGDFVELGTGRGFVFAAIAEFVKKIGLNKKIFLYDTFLPYKTNQITGEQNNEQVKSQFYADSYEAVCDKFSEYDFVTLIKGRCPEILMEKFEDKERKISFLHIDLNYHTVEIQSLEYVWSRLSPGAVILLDDYANPGREIQYNAYNLFFSKKNLSILTTASGQGIVIKS